MKKEEKNTDLRLGIDDSGRGPVIGPMVLAGVLVDGEAEEEFKKLGVKDSKMLTAKKRQLLAKEIKNRALRFEKVIITPKEIDGRNHVGINLNRLEAMKFAEIINRLNKQDKQEKIRIIVDCPSPNIERWKRIMERYIENKKNLEIVCEHKADMNHVVCAAASILAKTTRDAEIEKIKKEIGVNFGSGYSSDPVTCRFLEDYFEKHRKDGIFRKTWQTWKDACNRKEQKKLDEF